MNYKSFSDLSIDLAASVHKIPREVELIVGVPRSGLMAASILALNLNLRFCDVDSFIRNEKIKTGNTRLATGRNINRAQEADCILVVDDSISSGNSLEEVRAIIGASGFDGTVIYMAVYVTRESKNKIDIYSDIVPLPRFFQWNLIHREMLSLCCFDIDGVLCVDPTLEENDDGEKYKSFILNAKQIIRPSYKIGHLVTSRLEKYRPETEKWLNDNGIKFGTLHMLDLPSAAERRRLSAHGLFKSEIYKNLPETILFVERAYWGTFCKSRKTKALQGIVRNGLSQNE